MECSETAAVVLMLLPWALPTRLSLRMLWTGRAADKGPWCGPIKTKEQDWMDAGERAEAQRFKHLVQTIKDNLSDVKVFLVGGGAEKVAIVVGRTEAGWAGLR